MTAGQYWREGAATMGVCGEPGCGGALMAVEDMGAWTWCQCASCLKEAGVPPWPTAGRDPAASCDGTAEGWSF